MWCVFHPAGTAVNELVLEGVDGVPFAMSRLDDVIHGRDVDEAESSDKSLFLGDLFKKLVNGRKASNAFPAPDDFKYYESFPDFKTKSSQVHSTRRMARARRARGMRHRRPHVHVAGE